MLTIQPDNRAELFAAFVKAQSQMDGAKKTASNPAFKSRYADLAAVCDAVMDALTSNGLAVIQSPSVDETGTVSVETTIIHAAGGQMSSSMSIKPDKQNAHGIGSAITYARRYALTAMCGIAPEDDDGNAASITKPEATAKSSAQLKKNGAWQALTVAIEQCNTIDELRQCYKDNMQMIKSHFPASWQQEAEIAFEDRRAFIQSAEMDGQYQQAVA
jgi:hypothetical protein